ncbi:MAG: hypothetical protein M0R80_07535 [Proteobacteria bacterium]|jgi:hypothetical protein|nr:hypothetical protein [Pseudomonadota bacterium]
MKTLLAIVTFDREDPNLLGARICFPIPEDKTHHFQEACDYVVEHFITPEFIKTFLEDDCVGCDKFQNDYDLEEEPSPEQIKLKWAGYRDFGFEFDFEDDQGNEVTVHKSIEFMKLSE